MERFQLSIEIGNDNMSDARDVAWALRQVADRLERSEWAPYDRPIYDINGNQVGTYKYENQK